MPKTTEEMQADITQTLDRLEAKGGIALRVATDANSHALATILATLSRSSVITLDQGKALSKLGAHAFMDKYIEASMAYAERKVQ